jgi:hypothetical protein
MVPTTAGKGIETATLPRFIQPAQHQDTSLRRVKSADETGDSRLTPRAVPLPASPAQVSSPAATSGLYTTSTYHCTSFFVYHVQPS